MQENNIHIQTEQFDGPLGLLLMLIQKDELKIQELDISIITKQYLDYLVQMQELNFDVAGDYLYLAATLLHLKSQACLGDEELTNLSELEMDGPLITSRAELIRRLEKLQKFQQLGQELWLLPKKGSEIFTRPKISRTSIVNSILLPSDLSKLTLAMIDFIKKEKRKYTLIARDKVSIREKLVFLKDKLEVGGEYSFHDILISTEDIKEIVVTFISLLELARLKKIKIYQNEDKGNIYLQVLEDLKEFDVNLADGFEAEVEDSHKKNAEDLEPEDKILNELSEKEKSTLEILEGVLDTTEVGLEENADLDNDLDFMDLEKNKNNKIKLIQ